MTEFLKTAVISIMWTVAISLSLVIDKARASDELTLEQFYQSNLIKYLNIQYEDSCDNIPPYYETYKLWADYLVHAMLTEREKYTHNSEIELIDHYAVNFDSHRPIFINHCEYTYDYIIYNKNNMDKRARDAFRIAISYVGIDL